MKHVLLLIIISLSVLFIAGCTIVHNPAPATPPTASTQSAEVEKEKNQKPKRKKRDGRSPAKNKVGNKKSNPAQTVTTQPTKPAVSTYILKVTLTDIQCLFARDGRDESDDYGIQQYVVYKALGKDKKYFRRDINKFRERIDLTGQVSNILNPVIKGDMKNQIHVKENNFMNMRNRNMINNSLVFQVTSKELEDPNASFKIYTWLKEYSTTFLGNNDDKVLMKNTPVNVKINEVIKILSGTKKLNENTSIPAEDVGGLHKFHNFGAGYMHLANIQKIKPMVLEGPISFVNPETIVAVWVQFELID